MSKRDKSAPSFIKLLESISRESGQRPYEVFRSFCAIAACACGGPARAEEYRAEVSRWDEVSAGRFMEAFVALGDEMEARPYEDRLGPLYMEWGSRSGQQWGGEFYTPTDVCRVLARMTVPEELPADRPLEIEEPACGAGSMVLAAAEVLVQRGHSPLRMRVSCVDVARTACDMAFLNLTLWGIPARVTHGNTLSREVWGTWRNPFWGMARGERIPVHPTVAALAKVFALLESGGEPEPDERAPEPAVLPKANRRGQYSLDLEVPRAH